VFPLAKERLLKIHRGLKQIARHLISTFILLKSRGKETLSHRASFLVVCRCVLFLLPFRTSIKVRNHRPRLIGFAQTFTTMLFNLRLGYWLENPHSAIGVGLLGPSVKKTSLSGSCWRT
jgi:hypothetical protein